LSATAGSGNKVSAEHDPSSARAIEVGTGERGEQVAGLRGGQRGEGTRDLRAGERAEKGRELRGVATASSPAFSAEVSVARALVSWTG
jgi:hypothetical protein